MPWLRSAPRWRPLLSPSPRPASQADLGCSDYGSGGAFDVGDLKAMLRAALAERGRAD